MRRRSTRQVPAVSPIVAGRVCQLLDTFLVHKKKNSLSGLKDILPGCLDSLFGYLDCLFCFLGSLTTYLSGSLGVCTVYLALWNVCVAFLGSRQSYQIVCTALWGSVYTFYYLSECLNRLYDFLMTQTQNFFRKGGGGGGRKFTIGLINFMPLY